MPAPTTKATVEPFSGMWVNSNMIRSRSLPGIPSSGLKLNQRIPGDSQQDVIRKQVVANKERRKPVIDVDLARGEHLLPPGDSIVQQACDDDYAGVVQPVRSRQPVNPAIEGMDLAWPERLNRRRALSATIGASPRAFSQANATCWKSCRQSLVYVLQEYSTRIVACQANLPTSVTAQGKGPP